MHVARHVEHDGASDRLAGETRPRATRQNRNVEPAARRRPPPRRRRRRAGTRRRSARCCTGSRPSSRDDASIRRSVISPRIAAASAASSSPRQRPSHCGARFSMNAATPSRKSLLPYARSKRSSPSDHRPADDAANGFLRDLNRQRRMTSRCARTERRACESNASGSTIAVTNPIARASSRGHQVVREQHRLRARRRRARRPTARSSASTGSCRPSSRSELQSARWAWRCADRTRPRAPSRRRRQSPLRRRSSPRASIRVSQ